MEQVDRNPDQGEGDGINDSKGKGGAERTAHPKEERGGQDWAESIEVEQTRYVASKGEEYRDDDEIKSENRRKTNDPTIDVGMQEGQEEIIGEGCHFIDFLAFLAGAAPVSVSAHGLPDAGRYREDNVVLTFTFPDGSIGTVSYLANGDKAFSKERLEVFGGGAVAVLDDEAADLGAVADDGVIADRRLPMADMEAHRPSQAPVEHRQSQIGH